MTYLWLIAIGVVVAGIAGLVISRTALAPILRFSAETEEVTRSLARPQRLEETGAEELRRLAASFNHTLDALERSLESQRHLIADASHELRTPMAALRSNIQIFLDAERLPEDERRDLQAAIVAELDELAKLVSDVLQLARGSMPADRVEPVHLDEVVHDAVARARRRAPAVRFQVNVEPAMILNSPEQVSRAVTNVIDNARTWSAEDGVIEVSLSDGVLTVRDHGPGFAQDDLERVFDRFYRSENARRLPGSGLGLAIVKQTAEARGGFATAANAPDGGALLRVSFGPLVHGRRRCRGPARARVLAALTLRARVFAVAGDVGARRALRSRVLSSPLSSRARLIFFSTSAFSSLTAYTVGHSSPASRFALSLKPNVAYLVLNFCAGWK